LVKVAVCEAQTKKTNLLKMFSPETTSGLLHVGIQLGPHLFDWLSTSYVRIRRVFSCDSVILLSPNTDSSINPSDQETREAICEFINNFRRKEYSISSHNSRHFVDGMLNALNIQTNWSKIGSKPIEKFISSMTNVDRNNIPLSFFEIEKNIKCHNDLIDLWNEIQEPLQKELKSDPNNGLEVVRLFKELEAGYITRKDQNEQIDFGEYESTSN